MHALQIRNTVRDYDDWKAAFDKYERFREEHGVRSYRVLRRADDPHDVEIILDFDDEAAATAYRGRLEQVFATPQSRAQLTGLHAPELLEVVARESWQQR
jgi:hypothetical protein